MLPLHASRRPLARCCAAGPSPRSHPSHRRIRPPCAAVGSLPAAVKAAAALALVSAMVDLSGGRLVGTGMVDDGATPPRKIYPYTS